MHCRAHPSVSTLATAYLFGPQKQNLILFNFSKVLTHTYSRYVTDHPLKIYIEPLDDGFVFTVEYGYPWIVKFLIAWIKKWKTQFSLPMISLLCSQQHLTPQSTPSSLQKINCVLIFVLYGYFSPRDISWNKHIQNKHTWNKHTLTHSPNCNDENLIMKHYTIYLTSNESQCHVIILPFISSEKLKV